MTMAPSLLLVLGNKNLSSWSLRPWLLLRHAGIPFEERVFLFEEPRWRERIVELSPSRRVPALRHGDTVVWDSLAICEYVAETSGRGWPAERAARAFARSVSAEMHSGFVNLRTEWPMNARARNRIAPMTPGLEADIERIDELWCDCRRRFGSRGDGPWLFGQYTIADAMYAPVVLRFNTYRAQISETARWYAAAALEDAHMQQWVRAAQDEPWINATYEVGSRGYEN
jgi:glutathione S-transferase